MSNIKQKFKVKVNSIDPTKYGKAKAEKLFCELGQTPDKTEFIIESEQNGIYLKRKLGIVSALDIVSEDKNKATDNQVTEKKAEKSDLDNTKVEPISQDKLSDSDSSDDSEDKKDFEMGSNSGTTNGIKLEIPVIEDLTYQGIENYISDMKRAKDYGRFQKDKDLIFSSLVKSKRTGLYNDMAKGDEDDIEKYGAFLKNIFGLSEENLLRRFKDIKQKDGENALQFFNRLIRLFYRIRETDIPENIEDKIHKLEMTQAFVQGLKNREVGKIILRNRETIGFKELGKTALNYEKVEDNGLQALVNKLDHLAVENSEKAGNHSSSDDKRVNFVNSQHGKYNRSYSKNRFYGNKDNWKSSRDRSRDRNYSRGRSNSRTRDYSRGRDNSRGRNFSRERDSSRNGYDRDQRYFNNRGFNRSGSRGRNDNWDRNQGFRDNRNRSRDHGRGRTRETINDGRCFRCGYKGHIRAECRANDKTVAAYKKRQKRYRERS